MKIIHVDDDIGLLNTYKDLYDRERIEATIFTDPREVLIYLENNELPDVLVTDQNMPFMLGTELARKAREKYHNLPILFLTGLPTSEMNFDNSLVLSKSADYSCLINDIKYLTKER